jgi:mannan endo-1,4-beta-mannosidase
MLQNRLILKKLGILFFISFFYLLGKAAPTVYEAETGTFIGVNTSTAVGGYTGTAYVTGFDNAPDRLTINVSAASAGIHRLYIRYRSPFGDKTQDVHVNGLFFTSVVFPNSAPFVSFQAGTIQLNAGANTIAIHNSWGYVDIDNIGIEINPPNVYNITPNLIDPLADPKTVTLYNLLRGQFGNCIFSGQTGYWNELIAIAGKTPAVRGFDMQNYSPMNPWGWAGCCPAWGGWDDGTVTDAINWYNATGGIVTFHWHWFSPSGGSLQTSTFYTNSTNFDVSRATNPANQEYLDVIRDIDVIAVQLQRLENAGVPVLWRPLHEAGGAWFWWGADGPTPCLALYDLMYNRLTNYHGLHNLIWVWSTPEPAWYPGNSKVDIIGYDSYPGAYNYSTQKSIFDQLYTIVGGQKLIALTENGPIPDIAASFSQDAPWSYFMSWVDLVSTQNTNAHIVTSYTQSCNLEDLATLPVSYLSFTAEEKTDGVLLQWQTAQEIANDRFEIEKSRDGVTFSSIHMIKGNLNSTSIQHYDYTDEYPFSGKNYYRLKQVDVDNRHSYSTVVSVIRNNTSTISIAPNPSKGYITLSLMGETIKEITIVNSLGKTVFSKTDFDFSSSTAELSLTTLSHGIYFAVVGTKEYKRIIQFIIE